MRKIVFLLCSTLLFTSVFAQETYVKSTNIEIENIINKVTETNLALSNDSIELRIPDSIQFDEGYQFNDTNRLNNLEYEKIDLLTTEIKPLEIDFSFPIPDARPLFSLSRDYESTYEYMAYKESLRIEKKVKLEKLKVIGLYSAAIILNGIGDGMNNTQRKTMGHFFNAASIGVLLSTPFFINYDIKKWYWYFLTYASLRVTLFDASYNVTTKLPINFIGSTAITDKIYKKATDFYGASKAMGLVVGLTIPFRLL